MHSEIIKASKQTYPIKTLKDIYRRLRFLKSAKKHQVPLKSFIKQIHELDYTGLFENEPHVLGVVEWPYIHNEWDLNQRLHTILNHYRLIKTKPTLLEVADGKAKKIIDLHEYSAGCSIVVDKPRWFVREGEIVLNLFKDEHRIKSLAFTLGELNGELVMYIGAVQGIHANDDSLSLFKSITKDLEGLRPRSFLLDVLRMISLHIGVKKILAVSDHNRHHRHPYFAGYLKDIKTSHYDSIWLDHEGQPSTGGFYELPIQPHRRDIAEVSSNKRAMYRRRYEMQDNIQQLISKLSCFVYMVVLAGMSLWATEVELVAQIV